MVPVESGVGPKVSSDGQAPMAIRVSLFGWVLSEPQLEEAGGPVTAMSSVGISLSPVKPDVGSVLASDSKESSFPGDAGESSVADSCGVDSKLVDSFGMALVDAI